MKRDHLLDALDWAIADNVTWDEGGTDWHSDKILQSLRDQGYDIVKRKIFLTWPELNEIAERQARNRQPKAKS